MVIKELYHCESGFTTFSATESDKPRTIDTVQILFFSSVIYLKHSLESRLSYHFNGEDYTTVKPVNPQTIFNTSRECKDFKSLLHSIRALSPLTSI